QRSLDASLGRSPCRNAHTFSPCTVSVKPLGRGRGYHTVDQGPGRASNLASVVWQLKPWCTPNLVCDSSLHLACKWSCSLPRWGKKGPFSKLDRLSCMLCECNEPLIFKYSV